MGGIRTGSSGRRRASLVCGGTAILASLALVGTSNAVDSSRADARPSVCGGLAADMFFAQERGGLGPGHACAHLRIRQEGLAHDSVSDHSRSVRVAVARASTRVAAPASVVGRWSAARNPGTNTVGIAAVLLHTGRVLLLGGEQNVLDKDTPAYLYNPTTGRGRVLDSPGPIFCGSLTPLSDGRILSVGGFENEPRGIEELWLFDPRTEQWTAQPDTPNGRYYPTSTRLPDGRVVVAAGTQSDGRTRNPDLEVYTPPSATGTLGALDLVGPEHATNNYPHQVVMRDGRVLQFDRIRTYLLSPSNWSWTNMPSQPARVGNGSAHLMLPGGPSGSRRVMVIGGVYRGVTRATTQTFDYANRTGRWTLGPRMPSSRAHMNVVQVPDGSAFAIGGNSAGLNREPRLQTMYYNPSTRRWRNVAVQTTRRAYHSSALLLPDGRIMSAGDNGVGGGQQRIDFYSPPYLFRGPRPAITFAPARVRYGQRFAIRTGRQRVTRAVLMAPASTTHANDMNARHVRLALTRTRRGFTATTPTANVAPPGFYMLFVLNAKGVPSVARWVRVTA